MAGPASRVSRVVMTGPPPTARPAGENAQNPIDSNARSRPGSSS